MKSRSSWRGAKGLKNRVLHVVAWTKVIATADGKKSHAGGCALLTAAVAANSATLFFILVGKGATRRFPPIHTRIRAVAPRIERMSIDCSRPDSRNTNGPAILP